MREPYERSPPLSTIQPISASFRASQARERSLEDARKGRPQRSLCASGGRSYVRKPQYMAFLEPALSRRIINLSYPVMLAMLSQTLINQVDHILVGHLPKQESTPGQT